MTEREKSMVPEGFVNRWEQFYVPFINYAKDIASANGHAAYLDTVNLFMNNDTEIFHDKVHIFSDKNDIVAEFLARGIVEHELVP